MRGFLAGDFGDNLGDGGGRDEWRFVGGGIFGFNGLSGVMTMCCFDTIAWEPGRLRVSSSPTFTSGAEGQVIALAERGLSEKEFISFKDWSLRGFYLEDLADLGVEVVEELREGEAGSRAEDVCDKVLGRGRL